MLHIGNLKVKVGTKEERKKEKNEVNYKIKSNTKKQQSDLFFLVLFHIKVVSMI
jgi:hypothetical protein